MREKQSEALEALAGCALPPWEELPDLELYMDQVLSLVSRYLPPGRTRGSPPPW